jgi:hypothetical protein
MVELMVWVLVVDRSICCSPRLSVVQEASLHWILRVPLLQAPRIALFVVRQDDNTNIRGAAHASKCHIKFTVVTDISRQVQSDLIKC